MTCEYNPKIEIGFGRTITADQHWQEFQAIEETFACLCEELEVIQECNTNVYDHGTVSGTYYIDPALAVNHKLLVEGDVELIIERPEGNDPRFINLLIGDGGSGRFNFPGGASWSSDANGTAMDGKPWDPEGTAGAYGALVQCMNDELGWVHITYARHDLDFDGDALPDDIYNWR